MKRDEEQWVDLANKILRGEVDLAVLNDSTDVSGMQEKIDHLEKANAGWQANSRETRQAMQAMRNAINEHLPMPSMESDFLQGPENSIFCATVAECVIAEIERLKALIGKPSRDFIKEASSWPRITQKYIRRWPDSKKTKSWHGKLVHIQTDNGVWRIDGCGYTYAGAQNAGLWLFEEAMRLIRHCGPEKRGAFIMASDDYLKTRGSR